VSTTRIGGGLAVHHVTYDSQSNGARIRRASCGRLFIKKWTTNPDGASCFACMKALGIVK
jgi:ribosomal protein L34E